MPFTYQFYAASCEVPFSDNRMVTEYFYLDRDVPHVSRLQTTQKPERYGGPLFLKSEELVEVLKLARRDVRFSQHELFVRTVSLPKDILTTKDIDNIIHTELIKNFDGDELRVLGLSTASAGQK